MLLHPAAVLSAGLASATRAAAGVSLAFGCETVMAVSIMFEFDHRGSSADVYNILWAVVFGFATLNILGLAARRLEPRRRGLSFGEILAVTVVLLSIFLLGWEMLGIFHIFPIKLRR